MSLKHGSIVAVLVCAIAWAGWAADVGGAEAPNREADRAGADELSKEDDRAVRKIVAGIEEAWNAHDMKSLARLYREDAQLVNPAGMHWHGRDEIATALTAFHQTIFKKHSLHTDAVETRSVAPGVVVAVATEAVDGFTTPDGQVRPKARDRVTFVLVKGPDGWQIAHGHVVVVDEEAAKNNPVKGPGK
jgi:uncharacterized protein (TIGR02246 family)